jgi:hypothetical protein
MKMRYLKPNKGTTLPGEVCFLGVSSERSHEQGDDRHEVLLFAHVCARFVRLQDGQQTRATELDSGDPRTFWTYLDGRVSRSRPVTVFAYDVTQAVTLLGLWSMLDEGIYTRGTIIDADPPVVINIHTGIGRVCFIDVRNYFAMPLQELAASCDVEIENDWLGLDEVGIPYVEAKYHEQVTEVSMLALMSYVRLNDLGRFKQTIAMQALQAFRHRFAPRTSRVLFHTESGASPAPQVATRVYPLLHDKADVKEFERSANYSGHDECFFVGTIRHGGDFWGNHAALCAERGLPYIYGPVYHVDCNSLYPYVMRDSSYPSKYVGERDEATVEHLGDLLDRYCVIARVLIDSDNDTYPVRYKDGVIYCTGKYWTTLAGKELWAAWHFGEVVKVGYHTCYEQMNLFGEYVDYFFTEKVKYQREGNAAMELIVKMLLNTLQGKFSQRPKRWVERPDIPPQYRWGRWYVIDYDTGRVYRYRSIAGKTQEEVVDDEIDFSLPAIGAVVTSNARNYMASVRELCGSENVLYQGTDSLLLLEPGYRAMADAGFINNHELGLFRLKGTYEHVVIRNTQDYELGGHRTTRGLPKGARVVSGSNYQFDCRQTLQGMLFGIPAQHIAYTRVERTFNSSYRGGSVGKDGWVTPYHLDYAADRGDAWEGDFVEGSNATNKM